jgi:hypothetical protein
MTNSTTKRGDSALSFQPEITLNDLYRREMTASEHKANRIATLQLLTLSGNELHSQFAKDPEGVFDLLDTAEEYRLQLDALLELTDVCINRLMTVGLVLSGDVH